MHRLTLTLLFCSLVVSIVYACGGYEITNVKVTACEHSDAVFTDVVNTLNNNCDWTISGCVDNKRQINKGPGSYKITMFSKIMGKMTLIDNKKDGPCGLLEAAVKYPKSKEYLDKLDLPQKCPLKAGKFCINKTLNVVEFKSKIGLGAGKMVLEIKGKGENGSPGVCVRAEQVVAKKK